LFKFAWNKIDLLFHFNKTLIASGFSLNNPCNNAFNQMQKIVSRFASDKQTTINLLQQLCSDSYPCTRSKSGLPEPHQ